VLEFGTISMMLNEREETVMCCVAAGMTDAEIASFCSLSESAVAYHLTAIYATLGAVNRANAVALWYANRISAVVAQEQQRIADTLNQLRENAASGA